MSRLTTILLILFQLSCGAAPGGSSRVSSVASTGDGLFPVRFNPPKSLVERPCLAFEIQFQGRWERVAIQDNPGADISCASLRRDFADKSADTLWMKLTIRSATAPWGHGHASRIVIPQEFIIEPSGEP